MGGSRIHEVARVPDSVMEMVVGEAALRLTTSSADTLRFLGLWMTVLALWALALGVALSHTPTHTKIRPAVIVAGV